MLLYLSFYSTTTECMYFYSSCSKRVIKESSINRIAIITVVSRKFINQINNFWISSALPTNFTSIIFITSDFITYNYCKSLTKYVLMGSVSLNQTKDAVFMNQDHVKITVSRLKIIYTILSFKLSLLVIDIDIYLYKNPILFISKFHEDIISTVDRPHNINVGF